jgi:hypothetical protein
MRGIVYSVTRVIAGVAAVGGLAMGVYWLRLGAFTEAVFAGVLIVVGAVTVVLLPSTVAPSVPERRRLGEAPSEAEADSPLPRDTRIVGAESRHGVAEWDEE